LFLTITISKLIEYGLYKYFGYPKYTLLAIAIFIKNKMLLGIMAFDEQNKITYQQLVMKQIQKIQDVCSKELRDGTKTIKNLMGTQEIESEDTRHTFLQEVEILGSLLSPYFGKNNKTKGEFEDFCDLYDLELKSALDDEDFCLELRELFNIPSSNKVKDFLSEHEAERNQANVHFLKHKIKQGRRLFRSLVQLFKDNDFLANESYGEGPTEGDDGLDAIDEDDAEGATLT
jgi:hypothetical protein